MPETSRKTWKKQVKEAGVAVKKNTETSKKETVLKAEVVTDSACWQKQKKSERGN